MQLIYLLRLARRNWGFVILAVLVSVAAALAVTAQTPPQYQATTSLLVYGHDKEGGLSTAIQAGALSQQRVQSYASLLTSNRVIGRVAKGQEIERVAASVKVEAVPLTTLLRVTVTDTDPARATWLANRLGAEFPRVVDELERPYRSGTWNVKIRVVDPATVPKDPVSPRPLMNLLVALLAGLTVAFTCFVLRDRLDITVKTNAALQETSGSPTLGIIAYERDARQRPLVLRHDGHSTRAEAFRSLRTNLQFIGVDRRPRSLLITSCRQGDGKTSTAANLAIVLAQAGWRVLAVDADLRQPRLADYLGLEGAKGLTDVLIGAATLGEATQQWGPPALSVITAGQLPPNPSELLGSQEMRVLLQRVSVEYDLVIVDAPPLLAVSDAAALAAICDGTLLVARHGKTRTDHLARGAEMIRSVGARVVGTVLNAVPARAAKSYGYEESGAYQTSVTTKRSSTAVGV
ncbi:chromosome partitioning protein [Sphaerisporangium melleum]|uniref:non-specific protein-tyrosine kinase n=1 Tax=Sphaerisporangium melleum TaxID=321316 RepID=A0A917QTC4_9ACTN|nr:polysaccharide biosynthesis tyrosine autokinase [Sphaerisporangium melleum]GGK67527.1 chromosome partitioning protein [Sphaerisporangium melleum]GII68466.1 chromosome partitioning protein [Sphaerisporangium melleum]